MGPIQQWLSRLFELAHKAKSYQDYAVANLVTAVLIASLFEESSELSLEWETQDATGSTPSEVYYDLIVVCLGDHRLCIPVPLVEGDTAITLLKRAQIVDRHEHCREFVGEFDTDRQRDLMVELVGLVGASALASATQHLAEPGPVLALLPQEPAAAEA